ncbi:sulfurtransferase TusA family protein [candidate division KSB1 bacterium]|nr:sulfurtransferase TusA family protein [candidate division KSB1 bacterium]
MSEKIELNCLGMKCPRPIIEIAKAARKSSPGSILLIQADDLAFESDVIAWVENAKAKILNFDKQGDEISVQIELKK